MYVNVFVIKKNVCFLAPNAAWYVHEPSKNVSKEIWRIKYIIALEQIAMWAKVEKKTMKPNGMAAARIRHTFKQ